MRLTASPFRRVRTLARRLRDCTSGVSTIEFAFVMPVFMAFGLAGAEIAYMSSVNMQVSQVALSLADNASRLGQTDNSSVTPTITEKDVEAILFGAIRQGESFNLGTRGRVILSSLERDPATGRQYIHWQRCGGSLAQQSAYGNDTNDNGLGARTLTGVGVSGTPITAPAGSAVMVAEVYYEYTNLFANMLSNTTSFRQEAVFAIRDDRNLGPGLTGSRGASSCS